MELQLVIDNSRGDEYSLPKVIAHYEALIVAKEAQLLEDLTYYETQLKDLEDLDPVNKTGLKTIYRAHQQHIRRLLDALQER